MLAPCFVLRFQRPSLAAVLPAVPPAGRAPCCLILSPPPCLQAAALAQEHGWAINLGGGMHHAWHGDGSGW